MAPHSEECSGTKQFNNDEKDVVVRDSRKCSPPFFQHSRKNVSTLASRTNGMVMRRARNSPTISIKHCGD